MTCPRCGQDKTAEQFVSARGRVTRSCDTCRKRGRAVNRRHREAIGADGRRASPGRRPPLSRLRILTPSDPGRTFQFRGAVTVLIDGYEVHIPEGACKTVISPTGVFELLSRTGAA